MDLKALISKLDAAARNSLEAAAGMCVSHTHYDVEIEHFLLKAMDAPGADVALIFQHFGVSASTLAAELGQSIERLKRGNGRTPTLSPKLVSMLNRAWDIGSIDFNAVEVRLGFAILALATDEDLNRFMRDVSREFQKVKAEELRKNFNAIVEDSVETEAAAVAAAQGPAIAAGQGKTPHLDQYTINLTENAKTGKIDPVLGRDFEIRQIVDILMRRRQNNPILTGEAGVGKTAVVEGFALRVAQGDVPPPLRNVTVRTLDLALLQAGAGIKGEFENRLKGLIAEVKASPTPIILFIDEAHTMIGAGGAAGQNDAANLLKPALARGELRTIAATTWSEYKKYFEKDAALARRFQVVKVEEPSEEQCMVMLRGIADSLEKHHNVRILDEAVAAAVRLSHRYLAGRQLPDKAVSVLDTACARLALGQSATPPALEDATRRLDYLRVQERILKRESAVGADHRERLEAIAAEIVQMESRVADLRAAWERQLLLVGRIREIRAALEQTAAAPAAEAAASAGGTATATAVAAADSTVDGSRAELARLYDELAVEQRELALMQVCVDGAIVGEVISGWTGIPVGKMLKDEVGTLLDLRANLEKRIIGQSHALEAITQRIQTSRARLDDPGKPVGVFMFVGPSGVGKTETALALSDMLYGGEHNLITINMSEFQEAHTVSTLKGSPPGYVGYGEGGVLTEAVRRRPYSAVLLDEVEKAHPDVLELFYQVFDRGMMEDGEGREIDFKNTIILLTTNAGTDTLMRLCADPETMPSAKGLVETLKPELNKIFKPAFLGRLIIIPYFPVRDENLKRIVVLKLDKVKRRLRENHKIELTIEDAVLDEVARRCTEVESGARNIDHILTGTMLPDISRRLLGSIAAGESVSKLAISVGEDGAFVYT